MEDASLWADILRGDPDAIGTLYDRHAAAAYGLAVRLVGAAAAEDIVHDSFMVLLKDAAAYDPERGAFRSWLLRVVHNRCVNLLRRHRPEGEEALQVMPDPSDEPVDAIVANLAGAEVRTALGELPGDQREALVLVYYGGLSHSELAQRLDVPLGTAKSRVRRGLLALRDTLKASGTEAVP
jgi:RNA polymerase sigma-70 factor (ECF subfamily)